MKLIKLLISIITTLISLALLLFIIWIIAINVGKPINFNISCSSKAYDYVEQIASSDVNEITLNVTNQTVNINKTTDNKITIAYYESDNIDFTYELENGKISLSNNIYENNIFLFNFFNSFSRNITINIPANLACDLDIKTVNGRIKVEKLSQLNDVNLNTENASITIDKVYCDNLVATTVNGKVSVTNVIVEKDINVNTSNASINFEDVSAKNIKGLTTNGWMRVDDINATTIICKSSNGQINGDSIMAKTIDLTTSQGSIDVEIIGDFRSFQIDVTTSNGSIYIDDERYREGTYNNGAPSTINLDTSNASIDLDFDSDR